VLNKGGTLVSGCKSGTRNNSEQPCSGPICSARLAGPVILKSVSCPCFVYGSRLVQNRCICTFFKDGGEMNFTFKTAFFNEIFLALTPTTCILPLMTK